LLSITPKSTDNSQENKSVIDDKKILRQKQTLPMSPIGLLLVFVGLVGLFGGGYAAYLVFINDGDLALEFATIIAASSVFFALILIVLARILRIVSSLR
jgi:uncharacterized membrane protein YvbJ